jgi:hypothetical protein
LMQDISLAANWVTSIGGAVLTIYAVWRIVRRRPDACPRADRS